MNYIVFIILLLVFIILIINFFAYLLLKWYNDYSLSMEYACNFSHTYHLEYETYRHNMYRFLYNIDNNDFNNSIKLFTYTYYVVIIFLTIILLSLIINFFNLNSENFTILYAYIIFYFIYIYIGYKIIINYDNLKNLLKNEDNQMHIYAKIYKILNAIMYVNNFKENTLQYTDINIPPKKFDDIIANNIASYNNISDTRKIIQIKNNNYNRLDFIKYITLDQTSPHYFKKYFKKIYINVRNNNILKDNIYYIDSLKREDKLDIFKSQEIRIHNKNEVFEEYQKILEGAIDNSNSTNSDTQYKISYDKMIPYFENNKDLLFNDETNFGNFKNIIKSYISNIYYYIFFFMFIIFIILHYIYININNQLYSYLLISLLIIYYILLTYNNYIKIFIHKL